MREDMEAPLSWVLTVIREPSFERHERFDVLWDGQDVFEGRCRYWDLAYDMERMEQYYDGLSGQERLRERYKPREWSPTLEEKRAELPVDAGRALLESLKTSLVTFPVVTQNHAMVDGTRMTLVIRAGTGLQLSAVWDEGQHLELDQLANKVQGLFLVL
ncbi:hypothetical protein GCM10008938_51600 [Deinococcus roseus]|uniref:Uncharacterized protein n=2 Tax=Deinococcus roseus TaxID=392414 RepID=A0ABQ2DJB5_9DEIO|nr:hypothetical protein GCM10008938_51600 [Deinococcus roseus]